MQINYSNFERYNKDITRVVDKITLTTSRQMGFPQAFTKKHNVHDYDGIILYWEPASQAIAVEFTNDVSQSGFIKLVKSDKYGAYAGISTFLSTHSLEPKDYQRRYDYEKIDASLIGAAQESAVFVFQLVKTKEEEAYEA
jgi:hypothetical protein